MPYNAQEDIVTWGSLTIPADTVQITDKTFADQRQTGAGQLTFAKFGEESVTVTIKPDLFDMLEDLENDAKNRTLKSLSVYEGESGRMLVRYSKAVIGAFTYPSINRGEGSADSITVKFFKEGL
jgi:hypothetical protein